MIDLEEPASDFLVSSVRSCSVLLFSSSLISNVTFAVWLLLLTLGFVSAQVL